MNETRFPRKPVIKIVLTLAALSPLIGLFQNCTPFNALAGSRSDSSFEVDAAAFKAAKQVINTNCVSCHSANGSAAFAPLDFNTEAEYIANGLVQAGAPGKSKLLFRMKNYPVGDASVRNMPPAGPLSSADYQAVNNWIARMETSAGPYTCQTSQDPDANIVSQHARRLSAVQYRTTIYDLMNRFLSSNDANSVLNPLFSANTLPNDGTKYKRWDNSYTAGHARADFAVADGIATALASSSSLSQAFFSTAIAFTPGACSAVNFASLTDVCKQQFIRNVGLRALRRPLIENGSVNEVTDYMTEFTDASVPIATAEGNVVFRMMMSPNFLFQLETNENSIPTSMSVLSLSSYSVINRLSYTFWNTMPDETLLGMASGDFSVRTQYAAAVEYVFSNDAKMSGSTREFFNDWLSLDLLPPFNISSPSAQLTANGVTFDDNTRTSLITEIKDLGDYVSRTNGTFSDLFTTDISFARDPGLMAIYGTTQAAPQVNNMTEINAPRLPAGTRSGLLTRAALLVDAAGAGAENPVKRGIRIRRDIMCLTITPPPPGLAGALTPPVFDPTATVRDRYAHQTSAGVCMACHNVINPIGFALSNYNGLGFYQTQEPVFNADGSYANRTLSVNPVVDLSAITGDNLQSNTPMDLS